MMSITVAVCTKDRPDELMRLLGSLEAQTTAPGEVLIVDNAPSSGRARQLAAERFPSFRYVQEPVPGLNFARNRALGEAAGDIIAYIDDDAVADADWLAQTLGVFEAHPRVAACMGKVDALSLDTPGARLFEAYGGFGRGERRIHLPPGAGARPPGWPRPLAAWSIGVGGGVSMALRLDVARQLGGFDEALDMGQALPGGGDVDMIWRILESGAELIYEPRVHALHEHRAERGAAEAQILGHGRATIAALTKFIAVSPWPRKLPVIPFLAWRLVKPLYRLLGRAFGREPLEASLLWRLLVQNWRGLLAYPAALRLALARREQHRGAV